MSPAGNNALFKMKTFEYLGQIAEAMKSNTVVRGPRPVVFTPSSARRGAGSARARA